MDNRFLLFIGAFCILFVLGIGSYFSLFSLPKLALPEGKDSSLEDILIDSKATTTTELDGGGKKVLVTIASTTFSARIADTDLLRAKGLSGTENLGLAEGMFFIFPEAGNYSFWMSDLSFPIDIIWITPDQKIAGVAENAQPLIPNREPVYYVPPVPVSYVLEIGAGLYHHLGFATGTPVFLKASL
jgi:uncharacterized membrane protein (UPF0127 family)